MGNHRILLAEDDMNIRRGLVDTLVSEGYEVVGTADGKQFLEHYQRGDWDLLLLDIMMPELSGYDVCREVRKENATIPVLMLTAKGQEIDKVVGLELGADDYITKPFGIRELLARIQTALRRSKLMRPVKPETDLPESLSFGGQEVRRKTYELVDGEGRVQSLTQRELKLVETFYRHANEVLSRDFLLNEVWGIDYQGTTRTLDQHIAQLRKKVETDSRKPRTLLTVHGAGYRYVAADPDQSSK